MANVKASSNGSGMWSPQKAYLPHLLNHGLSREVEFTRLDVGATLAPEVAETCDEFDGPGAGATLILSFAPKVRMGAALVRRELLDGVAISPVTGTLTQPGGPGTAWQYNPGTAPNASTAAVVDGTADLSQAALYGSTGTLNGLTLILTVNGKYAVLTFSSPVNPVNPPIVDGVTIINPPLTILQIINNAFPGLTATLNGSNFLVLTDNLKGTTQTIVVGSGTANTALGLTPTTSAGTGHSYAVFYEYDATTIPNASTTVVGGTPPYVNMNQGP
jgi:hypothetical protein